MVRRIVTTQPRYHPIEDAMVNFLFTSKVSVNADKIRCIDMSLNSMSGTTVESGNVSKNSTYDDIKQCLDNIINNSNGAHDQIDYDIHDIFIVHDNRKVDILLPGARTQKSVNKCTPIDHDTFDLSSVLLPSENVPCFAILPINSELRGGLTQGPSVTWNSILGKYSVLFCIQFT